MAKFAGFLKRAKKFGTNILNGMINGMSKLNDVYKKIKPTLKPIVDAALSFVPMGGVIEWIGEKGLDKISNSIDFVKYGIDHPNTFLSSYNKNDFINGNLKPININTSMNEMNKRNQNLQNLRIINTK